MKSNHFVFLLVCLVGLATFSATAQEGVTLRLHPKKGLNCVVELKEITLSQGEGFEMSGNLEIDTEIQFKEVTETQTEMETQIESLRSNSSTIGTVGVKYDSDYPEDNNPFLAQLYDPLIKQPIRVTYDEMGNALSEIPETFEILLAKVFMYVFIPFPEKEVNVGSSWSFDTPKSSISWTYTITSVSSKKVEASFVGILKTDQMSGVIEGNADIHPSMGVVTRSSSRFTLTVTVASGQSSTMVMNTTISVKEK